MIQKCHKIISLAVMICFLVTDFARASPVLTPFSQNEVLQSQEPFELQIPTELGSVEAVFYPKAKQAPFVFHIQTLHGHYETAQKIKALIHYLKKEYSTEILFAEGAAGNLHPEYLQFLPDPEQNTQVLEALAKKGELTGVDLALVKKTDGVSPMGLTPMKAIGIESPEHYRTAHQAFKKVIGNIEQSQAYIEKERLKLDKQTSKVLSKALKETLKYWHKLQSNHFEFVRLLKFVREEAKNHLNLNFENPFAQFDWPQLTRLVMLQELESRLDEKAFEEEKQRLPVDMSFLRTQESVHRKTVESFLKKAIPKGFQFKDYPQITYQLSYKVLESELNAKELFNEFETIFEKLFEAQVTTPEAKVLVNQYKDLILLQKLLTLELTPNDWSQASSMSFLRRQESVVEIKDLLDHALNFYNSMPLRESAFMENMESSLSLSKPAILVTGGFHAEGMKKLFRESGMGYAVILPKVSGSIDNALYHKVMMRSSNLEQALLTLNRQIAHEAFESEIELQRDVVSQTISDEGFERSDAAPFFRAVEAVLRAESSENNRSESRAPDFGGFDQMLRWHRTARQPFYLGRAAEAFEIDLSDPGSNQQVTLFLKLRGFHHGPIDAGAEGPIYFFKTGFELDPERNRDQIRQTNRQYLVAKGWWDGRLEFLYDDFTFMLEDPLMPQILDRLYAAHRSSGVHSTAEVDATFSRNIIPLAHYMQMTYLYANQERERAQEAFVSMMTSKRELDDPGPMALLAPVSRSDSLFSYAFDIFLQGSLDLYRARFLLEEGWGFFPVNGDTLYQPHNFALNLASLQGLIASGDPVELADPYLTVEAGQMNRWAKARIQKEDDYARRLKAYFERTQKEMLKASKLVETPGTAVIWGAGDFIVTPIAALLRERTATGALKFERVVAVELAYGLADDSLNQKVEAGELTPEERGRVRVVQIDASLLMEGISKKIVELKLSSQPSSGNNGADFAAALESFFEGLQDLEELRKYVTPESARIIRPGSVNFVVLATALQDFAQSLKIQLEVFKNLYHPLDDDLHRVFHEWDTQELIPNMATVLFEEAERILKPGGVFFLAEPMGTSAPSQSGEGSETKWFYGIRNIGLLKPETVSLQQRGTNAWERPANQPYNPMSFLMQSDAFQKSEARRYSISPEVAEAILNAENQETKLRRLKDYLESVPEIFEIKEDSLFYYAHNLGVLEAFPVPEWGGAESSEEMINRTKFFVFRFHSDENPEPSLFERVELSQSGVPEAISLPSGRASVWAPRNFDPAETELISLPVSNAEAPAYPTAQEAGHIILSMDPGSSVLQKDVQYSLELIGHLPLGELQKIGVVGSGFFTFPHLLALMGKEVTFIDMDPRVVENMKESWGVFQLSPAVYEVGTLRFLEGTFGELDFELMGLDMNFFDMITMADLAGGIDHGGARNWLLQSRDLLKKEGGYLVIDEDLRSRSPVLNAFSEIFPNHALLADGRYFFASYNHERSKNRIYRVNVEASMSEARWVDKFVELGESLSIPLQAISVLPDKKELFQYHLYLDARDSDFKKVHGTLKDFLKEVTDSAEIVSVLNQVRTEWQKQGWNQLLGDFLQHFILTQKEFSPDVEEYVGNQISIFDLAKQTDQLETRLDAWWIYILAKVYHLRHHGMHPEKAKKRKGISADNEILATLVHDYFLPDLRAWRRKNAKALKAGDPEVVAFYQNMLWVFGLALDIRIHDSESLIYLYRESVGFVNPRSIFPNGGLDSIPYFLNKMLRGAPKENRILIGDLIDLYESDMAQEEPRYVWDGTMDRLRSYLPVILGLGGGTASLRSLSRLELKEIQKAYPLTEIHSPDSIDQFQVNPYAALANAFRQSENIEGLVSRLSPQTSQRVSFQKQRDQLIELRDSLLPGRTANEYNSANPHDSESVKIRKIAGILRLMAANHERGHTSFKRQALSSDEAFKPGKIFLKALNDEGEDTSRYWISLQWADASKEELLFLDHDGNAFQLDRSEFLAYKPNLKSILVEPQSNRSEARPARASGRLKESYWVGPSRSEARGAEMPFQLVDEVKGPLDPDIERFFDELTRELLLLNQSMPFARLMLEEESGIRVPGYFKELGESGQKTTYYFAFSPKAKQFVLSMQRVVGRLEKRLALDRKEGTTARFDWDLMNYKQFYAHDYGHVADKNKAIIVAPAKQAKLKEKQAALTAALPPEIQYALARQLGEVKANFFKLALPTGEDLYRFSAKRLPRSEALSAKEGRYELSFVAKGYLLALLKIIESEERYLEFFEDQVKPLQQKSPHDYKLVMDLSDFFQEYHHSLIYLDHWWESKSESRIPGLEPEIEQKIDEEIRDNFVRKIDIPFHDWQHWIQAESAPRVIGAAPLDLSAENASNLMVERGWKTVREVKRYLYEGIEDTVLDIGSGRKGGFAFILALLGADVTSFEKDPKAIQALKEKYQKLESLIQKAGGKWQLVEGDFSEPEDRKKLGRKFRHIVATDVVLPGWDRETLKSSDEIGIPETDESKVQSILDGIAELKAPDGIVLLSIPDTFFKLRRHYYEQLRDTLIKTAGLEMLGSKRVSVPYSLGIEFGSLSVWSEPLGTLEPSRFSKSESRKASKIGISGLELPFLVEDISRFSLDSVELVGGILTVGVGPQVSEYRTFLERTVLRVVSGGERWETVSRSLESLGDPSLDGVGIEGEVQEEADHRAVVFQVMLKAIEKGDLEALRMRLASLQEGSVVIAYDDASNPSKLDLGSMLPAGVQSVRKTYRSTLSLEDVKADRASKTKNKLGLEEHSVFLFSHFEDLSVDSGTLEEGVKSLGFAIRVNPEALLREPYLLREHLIPAIAGEALTYAKLDKAVRAQHLTKNAGTDLMDYTGGAYSLNYNVWLEARTQEILASAA